MPEWWLEVVLPSTIFGLMLILWIIIPPKNNEDDFGSKIRSLIIKMVKK
tara:strand:+ start:246 stop:392 length:147 start_codon:yes stop_codon:yes gene_type:complete